MEFTHGRYQLNESLTYLCHLFHIHFTVRQHFWMTKGANAGGLGLREANLYICWIKFGSKDAAKKTLH